MSSRTPRLPWRRWAAFLPLALVIIGLSSYSATAASALTPPSSTCNFVVSAATWKLQGNCDSTDTIFIPSGVTVDGLGWTITPHDFVGSAVLQANHGAVIVKRLNIVYGDLATSSCVNGINLNGAWGQITRTTIEMWDWCGDGINVYLAGTPHPIEISLNHINGWAEGDGINTGGGAAQMTIMNNVLAGTSNAGDGINLYVRTALVDSNTIHGGGDEAIEVKLGKVTIQRNTIYDVDEAVEIEPAYPAAIIGAQILNNSLTVRRVGIEFDVECNEQVLNALIKGNFITWDTSRSRDEAIDFDASTCTNVTSGIIDGTVIQENTFTGWGDDVYETNRGTNTTKIGNIFS